MLYMLKTRDGLTMKKHAFLMPLASLVAALATNQATANVLNVNVVVDPTVNAKNTISVAPQSERISARGSDKQFEFLLKRGENGLMMAAHHSHSYHASHASHSSHYSGL